MACNENIIKNIANEVARNCHMKNINLDPKFLAYVIELLLLNPKYGKLFAKNLNRNKLEYFVGDCDAMIERGGASLDTLLIQFIMRSNYGNLNDLIDTNLKLVNSRLQPLRHEILDADPDIISNHEELKKIYRKISIYIILFSGIGNASDFINLKEGIGAMESVFPLEDLGKMLLMPRKERQAQIDEVIKLTSGVRLFNRACKLGGELITDLPTDLLENGAKCFEFLENSLISVMKRVFTLTTAIEDSISLDEKSDKVTVHVVQGLTITKYEEIFELLIFNRQCEIYIRRMLADVHTTVEMSKNLYESFENALQELHRAVKNRSVLRSCVVFPLFIKVWDIWRDMQNTLYFVSHVKRLMTILSKIQVHNCVPDIRKMLEGKILTNDEKRMNTQLPRIERVTLEALDIYTTSSATSKELWQVIPGIPKECEYSVTSLKETKRLAFLGFCAMSLTVGALVPCNLNIGFVEHKGHLYGFAKPSMACRFAKEPDRFVNEVIQYAREHPQIINLLKMDQAVRDVKNVEKLYIEVVSKKQLKEKDVQTAVHPIEEYIERDYKHIWDLWEWKRRACQLVKIVNSRTHSTQTNHSHLRSEIHCQTTEPRDKNLQTMKEAGINTNTCNFFFWGLRGQLGDGQHYMDLEPKHKPEKSLPSSIEPCSCDRTSKTPSEQSYDFNTARTSYESFAPKKKIFYDANT